MDLDPRGFQAPARDGVAVRHHDHARPDGQHVAAEGGVLLLGHLHQADPEVRQQRVQARGQERQEHDRDIVRDGRDDREEMDELRRALPVRDVEDPHVPAGDRRELARPGVVGAQRPPDAQEVRPEPERVAALDRAGPLDPAQGRDAAAQGPGLQDVRLARAVGLARAQRDGAAVGDHQRVEDVDEVGIVRLGVQDVDRRAEARQGLHEPVVLAARGVEVDRSEEAGRGIVERPREGGPGRLHEDLEERRGHALGAPGAVGRGGHSARIRRAGEPGRVDRLADRRQDGGVASVSRRPCPDPGSSNR